MSSRTRYRGSPHRGAYGPPPHDTRPIRRHPLHAAPSLRAQSAVPVPAHDQECWPVPRGTADSCESASLRPAPAIVSSFSFACVRILVGPLCDRQRCAGLVRKNIRWNARSGLEALIHPAACPAPSREACEPISPTARSDPGFRSTHDRTVHAAQSPTLCQLRLRLRKPRSSVPDIARPRSGSEQKSHMEVDTHSSFD